MSKYSTVGMIVAVVGLVVFVPLISTSPPFRKCVENVRKENVGKPAIEQIGPISRSIGCFADAVQEGHGITTALATIVIGVFTFTLWVATDRLRELAEGQEISTAKHLRAYVDAGPGGGETSPTLAHLPTVKPKTREIKDGKMLIRMECANHGRTPAKLVRFWWDVRPFQSLPKIPPYPTDKKEWLDGGMYVSPDKVFTTRAQRFYTMEWTDRHIAFGRIDYEDVFGKPHSYGFFLSVIKNKEGTDFSHPPLREAGYEKYWEES